MKLIVTIRTNTFTLQDVVNCVVAMRDDLKALDSSTLHIEMREVSELPVGVDLRLELFRRKARRGRAAEHSAQCLVNVAAKALGPHNKYRGIVAVTQFGIGVGSAKREAKEPPATLEEK